MTLEAYLVEKKAAIDAGLRKLLPPVDREPQRLHEALHYTLLTGGKRIRPILALTTYALYRDDEERIMPSACALEMIHTYSLIHDDLPALDNSDLRRRVATCHRQFDEATAILAGDALLTYAFELLSGYPRGADAEKIRVLGAVARAIGTEGMIGGQVADILAEGTAASPEAIESIHLRKTATLLRASAEVGAIFGGADEDELELLARYGEKLGFAFQIVDDLLDVEGEVELVGKEIGGDAARRKPTYPSVFGVTEARKKASALAEEARRVLSPFGEQATRLEELATFLLSRQQ